MANLGQLPTNDLSSSATLLVVDSDKDTRESLQLNLQHEGYRVLVARNGQVALQLTSLNRPDLMLLELDLPDISGFEVCRALRPQQILPIVILSQRKDAVDKVLGLELGADDYLTKPFSWRELLARVHAQLRRMELGRLVTNPVVSPTLAVPPTPTVYHLDNLSIHLNQRQVTRDGQVIPMTPKEFDLLVFLVAHPREVFSRAELLQKVWGQTGPAHAKTVDVHIRWLRAKLEAEPTNPRLIQTVYGIGYKLAWPAQN